MRIGEGPPRALAGSTDGSLAEEPAMPNHYVSRIDNIIIVTVVYDCDLDVIQTSSFGLMAMDTEVVWNLVIRGSDCAATFGYRPIQAIGASDSIEIADPRRVSDTQA